MNIIKELWHGNIIPQEDSRTNSKEMKELLGYMARHHEDLEKTFSEEQKEIFEKFHDCWSKYMSLAEAASEKIAPKQKFEPTKSKHRKPGTGCVSKINDNLWEGRYTPTVNGKRMARNVYAHTEEECEAKLAELIREMKIEIEKLKQGG